MASSLRNDAALGFRAGLALGLFELGLALPARWGGLDEPLLRGLMLLVPLGAYPVLGAALALLAGPAGRKLRLPGALLVPLVALALAVVDLTRASGALREPLAWPFLVAAAAQLVLVRRPWPRRLPYGLVAACLPLAAAGVLAWLAGDRDPARLGPAPAAAPEGAGDVVLVTWDTVRADVLPPYGGTGLETPALDQLAGRSVVFEEMIAVAPITGPTHATLLSGRVPPSHGLRSMGTTEIAAEVPLLAESFRAAGYDTAAFVSAPPLRAKNGFARGFRVYDDRLRADRLRALTEIGPREMALVRWLREKVVHHRDAQLEGAVVLERARAYLEGADRPCFLWLHFFDAHGPHEPAPAAEARARALAAGALPAAADPEACGENLLLYRAEIMELDALLGEFIGLLEARDPGLARTSMLLTADHGQCFGEGGYRNNHTSSLMDATQHVPALLHLPGGREGGRRVAGPVYQADVAATLAALAGLEAPEGHQGVDLLPAAAGGTLPARAAFGGGFYLEAWQERLRTVRRGEQLHDERLLGIRAPGWKLFYPVGDPAAARLFRLGPDGEVEQALDGSPQAEPLRKLLNETAASLPRAVVSEREMSAEDSAELAALGYVDDDG